MHKIILHLFLVGMTVISAAGQEVRVEGRFLKDSIKIGERVSYSLTARYPRNMDVIFPDSTYAYPGFEYISRHYSPTRSNADFSFDSVVYYLTTFEIEASQPLSLPVFILHKGDSTPVYAKSDTVYLREVITSIPDPVALKENTVYIEVDYPFNYPYFLAFSFFTLLGIVLVYSMFGNKISRQVKLYRMKKDYNKFIAHFSLLIEEIKNKPIAEKTEQTLIFWKGYLEKLDNIPYKKLTSKEIVAITNSELIKPALQNIDRKIYGGAYDDSIHEYFETLRSFAVERYKNKTEEISNV